MLCEGVHPNYGVFHGFNTPPSSLCLRKENSLYKILLSSLDGTMVGEVVQVGRDLLCGGDGHPDISQIGRWR